MVEHVAQPPHEPEPASPHAASTVHSQDVPANDLIPERGPLGDDEQDDEDDDAPPTVLRVRCKPCVSRGPLSRCNKVWPVCSKCVAMGTERSCFQSYMANPNAAARTPEPASPRAGRQPHSPARLGPVTTPRRPIFPRSASAAPILQSVRRPDHLERRSRSPPPNPITPRAATRIRSPPLIRRAADNANLSRLYTEKLAFLRSEVDTVLAEAASLGVAIPQSLTTSGTSTDSIGAATTQHATNSAPAPIASTATHAHANPYAAHNYVEATIHAGHNIPDRKRPQVVPGLVGEKNFGYVPDVVRRAFTGPNGWNSDTSLWYFTDEYVNNPSKLEEINDIMKINHTTNQIEWSHKSLPDVDESSMNAEQFIRAWQHLSGFLIAINHPDALHWREHFQSIMQEGDFFSAFPKWRLYCHMVRRRALQQGIDPSIRQTAILEQATVEHLKRVMAEENRRQIESGFARLERQTITKNTPQASTSSQPGPAANRPARAPAPSNNKPNNPTTLPLVPGSKCFVCGSQHGSISCTATKLVNGNPLQVARNDRNEWTINVPPTTPLSTAPSDPRRIVTPLIPSAWADAIQHAGIQDQFRDVPLGLQHGFRIGVSSILDTTTVHKNHSSATSNPSVVLNHINTELSLGRYSGPFSISFLHATIGHFRSSPLGVVDKPSSPGSFRIIQDFSFPRDPDSVIKSVNSEIDTSLFDCEWGTFQDIVDIMLSLPPDAQAATFDVDAAYRRMPVDRKDQPHIIVQWNDQFYIDHCVPFGAASSNGIFGRCGDCMVRILTAHGIHPVKKWVDDFVIFRVPSREQSADGCLTFLYDEETIYAIAKALGWPWKPSKTCPFAALFTYLGFLWDIANRKVSIPPKKATKFSDKIRAWLECNKVTLSATEGLLGSLIHCAWAVPKGRSRVVGLSRFVASFSHEYKARFETRRPSVRAIEDANWWLAKLSIPNVGHTLRERPPMIPYDFFMDASTSFGIGIVAENQHAIWKLSNGCFRGGRDIGWAEMVAVELALDVAIARGIRHSSIRFWSDNQGVIGAIQAGRSRNDHQNLVLQCIFSKQHEHDIFLIVEYINTSQNPADGPSRGIPPGSSHPLYHTNYSRHIVGGFHHSAQRSCTEHDILQ